MERGLVDNAEVRSNGRSKLKSGQSGRKFRGGCRNVSLLLATRVITENY